VAAPADIKDSILDTVGETPLVRLSRIAAGLTPQVVAKVEYFNPGGSIKDRVAMRMVEAAEADGRLRPGGTIIEPTSGNTGTGLAIAARIKGYRVIAVMPDKMSKEKIDLLRAYGAEVVVTPTDVDPDSPQAYYRVADRLTREIPGAFQPNQYANPANPQTHYDTTGPELWRQTGGAITHLVVGVGTGGTITGTGKFLKEQNPAIEVIGADPVGSIYSNEEVHPYLDEGVGECGDAGKALEEVQGGALAFEESVGFAAHGGDHGVGRQGFAVFVVDFEVGDSAANLINLVQELRAG